MRNRHRALKGSAVLHDQGGLYRLYIGTGTAAQGGCVSRLNTYHSKSDDRLPQRLRLA
jgi:hypothetical protein